MNGRFWTFEDLNEIAQLEKECFSDDAWNVRSLAESFLSGRFIGTLLEEDGVITAYGGVSFVEEEGELELIATAEMYRRCGRGQKVLEDLLRESKKRGVKRLFLEVRVSNAPALMFYLKNGFEGLYARSRYYANGEDAIVMKKEL